MSRKYRGRLRQGSGLSKFLRPRTYAAIAAVLLLAVLVFNPLQHALAAQVTIDSSVTTDTADKKAPQADTVFISDQVGYTFYMDSDGTCVYSKTTDGGTTWGTAVVVNSSTSCALPGIWYDGWQLSGGTGGTVIHILTKDTSTSDVYYNELNTTNDTLADGSSPVNISTDKSNSFGSNAASNQIFISRDTSGGIWAGIPDSSLVSDQPWIKYCSSSCNTAANWVDRTPAVGLDSQIDEYQLFPLAGGSMLLAGYDNTSADIVSLKYTSGTASWDAAETLIDGSPGGRNSTYDGKVSATVNYSTGNIYLAYTAQNSTLGGGDDDIRTATYSASGGSWTAGTDALTNSSMGLTRVGTAIDDNTGDIYVVYSAEVTPGTTTSTNIYYEKSTDGMSTWGAQSSAVNTSAPGEDIFSMKVNPSSNERLYVTWHDPDTTNPDKLYGNTLIDLTPPVSNTAPAAPTLSSPANAATGVSTTPQFQLRTTDADNDYLRYKIQVCSTSNCSSVVRTIDETASQTGWSGQDQQTSTAYTGSSTISGSTMASHTYQTPALSAGTQYWWRAYAIDPGGTNTFSSASSIQSFTTASANTTPSAPTLSSPANAATGVSTAPQFQLGSTDTEGDYLQYKIQICTTSNCSGVEYTIDQTASQTGWSGQDANGSLAYASGTTAVYTLALPPLSGGTQYWWRAYAIDPAGTNTFSSASSIQTFTTSAATGGVVIGGGTVIAGGTKIQN